MPDVMPRKILVPVDLSEKSRAALVEAAEIARFCNASLYVMYAEEFLPQLDSLVTSSTATAVKTEGEKRELAEKFLKEQIASSVPPTVPVEYGIVLGQIVPAILKTATDVNADWVVMATHGRTGVKRWVLGSVTEEVLRKIDKPVLTVHAA